jgi:APA family basic amino acid/polyamine antiporter
MKRELSLLDAIGVGINGIVGSGIYLLVGPLARVGGGASVFGVLACGVLCVLIALCFAELSSKYDQSGGPYIYARDAFGKWIGFGVGWLGMSTGVLGLAAVASGFAAALNRYLAVPPIPTACAVILFFGAINWSGAKAGGRTSTALSIAKIAPLLLLAIGSLAFAAKAPLSFSAKGIAGSAFLSIFMMSGFEYAAVPAGEVKDAKRVIPVAIVGSITGASALYALLQLGALGALPDVASIAQPLPDLAGRVAGAPFEHLIAATALVSMLGFCAGVALVAPRYFIALAHDGHLPRSLTNLKPAIAASTLFACALAVVLGYASLVDVSNVVILSGYALTCLATQLLRRREGRYRAPRFVPVLAMVAALALLASARPNASQLLFAVELLAAGFAIRAIHAAAS